MLSTTLGRIIVGTTRRQWRAALLVYMVCLPMVAAAATDVAFDPRPIRPTDTSSPRDTLQSFLINAEKVAEEQHQGGFTDAGYRAFRHALETMDFSTTPEGGSWFVRAQRASFLHEVIARVALPPEAEIPGDEEVAGSGIRYWTVPGTDIRIERIDKGPRAGEFLFAAGTVAKIDRLYRKSRHLLHGPGTSPWAYDATIDFEGAQFARMRSMRNRLKPVDTSNPRATLEGFLDSMNRAYELVAEANNALGADSPTMSSEEAQEAERMAAQLLERATVALDLSQVPAELRRDIGEEKAMQLKEVLDRLILPPVDAVPDAQMVAAARDGVLGFFIQGAAGLRWRLPNTEIEIAEVTEGDRTGQFLFSAATVERISDDFEEVRDLPYRVEHLGGTEYDYVSPELSRGFYDDYVSSPGYLIPRAHPLGKLIDGLPEWLKSTHADQTIWQWIGLVILLLLGATLTALLARRVRRLAKGSQPPKRRWLTVLTPAGIALVASLLLRFIDNDLNITGKVLATVSLSLKGLMVLMVAWAVFIAARAVAESVIASPRMRIKEESIDATVWRIGTSIAGFLLAILIIVQGLQSLGANIVPVLAGLGVGGLAVALAARETLVDIFGSLMILADRPYRIGHWVIIGDKEGTVEHIGIRSTRIRTFYDSVLSIPNSQAVSKIVDNMGMRTYRRVYTKLGIRCDTPPERIEALLEGIKRIIQANPTTRKDYFHVVLNDFGPHSLVVMLYFFVKVPDWAAELVERQRVFLEVLRLAERLDVELAFPTQTLQVESFPGQPGREPPPAASDQELRGIAESFASTGGSGRPRGLGIFVPPNEER